MTTTLTESNQEYIPQSMETVPCPLCGKTDAIFHEKIGYNEKFKYVKCTHCSNVYLNPRPTYDDEFLDIAYSVYGMDNEYVVNDGKFSDSDEEVINRYLVTLKELDKKYNKSGKIMDLGCGTGLFCVAAKRLGWETYGVDISGPMTDFVQRAFNVPTKAGQFHELDFRDWGKMDVIYCSHVIEHIPNPNEWMKCFKENLKDDGVLVLNVPNQYAPEKIIQRFLKKIKLRKTRWEKWRTPDHLYEPHFKSMKYLFDKSGMELVEYYTYSSREAENESIFSRIFHKVFKLGSKHRYFLKKRN